MCYDHGPRRWLQYGLELMSDVKLSSMPKIMHVCERILSEGGYEGKFGELRSSSGAETVRRVLQKMKELGQEEHSEFDSIMSQEIDRIKNDQMHKYTVVFPLGFRLPTNSDLHEEDAVDETRIQICKYDEFGDKYLKSLKPEQKNMIGLSDDSIPLLRQTRVLLIEFCARDSLFAFLEASSPAVKWTAILSYSQASIVDIKIPPLPFTSVKLPRFGMVFKDVTLVQSYGGVYPIPNESHKLIFNLSRHNEFMERFEALPRLKMKRILRDAVELYAEAVSDTERNFAFLKLWIGLELMARLREKLSDKKVANRMKRIFYLESSGLLHSRIDTLLQKRNLFMHEGDFGAVQWHDILFAKELFEEVLKRLMKYCSENHDVEWIRALCDYSADGEPTLSESKDAIEFLIEQRRKDSNNIANMSSR